MRKIGEVSKLAGVSIRTLRYYDEIGLLCPKTLESGYRVYDDADLERLWQILFCRDLGFSLETIHQLVFGKQADFQLLIDLQMDIIKSKMTHFENLLLTLSQIKETGFHEKMLKVPTGAAKVIYLSNENKSTDLLKLIPNTKLVFICMDSPCESSTKQARDIAKLLKAQSIHTVGVLFENSNIFRDAADIFDAVVYSNLADMGAFKKIAASISESDESGDEQRICIYVEDFISIAQKENTGYLLSANIASIKDVEALKGQLLKMNMANVNAMMYFHTMPLNATLEQVFENTSCLAEGYTEEVQQLFTVQLDSDLTDVSKMCVLVFADHAENKSNDFV